MTYQTARPSARAPLVRHLTWQAADGLELSATAWEPHDLAIAPAVLCLSGLSRNARDFTALAENLSLRGHLVVAMDYRGRGRSARDPDWRNYTVEREADDIDRGIEALGLERLVVIGTSRGGLHGLLLAWRHPDHVAGLVLNDIGPTIEADGLRRLCQTVGQDMKAPDWNTAVDKIRAQIGGQFPGLEPEDWRRFAEQLYVEADDGLHLDYDAALSHALADFDPDQEVPDFWPVFDAIATTPMLVLRGAHSDILSEETHAEMLRRNPHARALTVPDEGHAPVLWDQASQKAIAEFVSDCADAI